MKNNSEKNLYPKIAVLWKSGSRNTKYVAGPTLLPSSTYIRLLALSASLALVDFVPCDRLIRPSRRKAAERSL